MWTSTAIRDAFDAAKRQLQDYSRRQRGEVKFHEEALRARIRSCPRGRLRLPLTADGRRFTSRTAWWMAGLLS
jgi:hypothetical protein